MNTKTTESALADAVAEKQKTRPQDSSRRVVLERRAKNSDRREKSVNQHYQGPFRRNTVDRRELIKDRRSD